MGDVGHVDADGYLYLTDRASFMIISGGVNIYPAEIESVLIQMPGVRDCAVFGIPDDEFGEQICAYVEPAPPAPGAAAIDAIAVRQYLGQHVARYKVPKVVDAFDQALGSVMKQLVNWTLKTPPPRPPSDSAPYDINRYRNPANAVIDSANCPKGNDASMVPLTDE